MVERRPLRHCPGLEDAVELKLKVITEARGIMLLNHKPPTVRRLDLSFAARFARFLEIALSTVCRKIVDHELPAPSGLLVPQDLNAFACQ